MRPTAVALLSAAAIALQRAPRRALRLARVGYAPAVPASTKRRPLHPLADVAADGSLAVSDGHAIYYQVRGKDLPTALFLHGGPGAGCVANHARFFDPEKWRVVLLDQRGCGKSTYPGPNPLEANDTRRLVEDLEVLRRAVLGDAPWDCVLGGSWGVALALAYAQAHPARVRSIALRGVCTMRPREIDWLFSPRGGAAALAPRAFAAFRKHVGVAADVEDDRAVLHGYYERFAGTDVKARDRAARAWMSYEGSVSSVSRRAGVAAFEKGAWTFEPSPAAAEAAANRTRAKVAALANRTSTAEGNATTPRLGGRVQAALPWAKAPAQPMLTCGYSVHDGFLRDGELIEGASALAHIPAIAVQGAADTICPPQTAYDLHRAWPELELRVVSGGGHSHYDPDIQHELLEATDRLHARLFGKS
mmetsp:Transcript_23695/g.71075  ORF Transcript_23695/g.71075 Transcript_23695/m.71075 type:complete len:419 (-) Transcript_23695:16-1272(-)